MRKPPQKLGEMHSEMGNVYPVKGKPMLKTMSRDDYETLLDMGFLYEFYPEATGNYDKDCK